MTSPNDRRKALEILDEGMANGARASKLARLLGVGLTTLQRWRRQFVGDGDGVDRRKGSRRHVAIPDVRTAAIAAGWRQNRGRLLNCFGIVVTPCKRLGWV